jgi:heme/copper-type cytochrome/quinol oxidase subunit 2
MRLFQLNSKSLIYSLLLLSGLLLVFQFYTLAFLLVMIVQVVQYKNSPNDNSKFKHKRIIVTMLVLLPIVFVLDCYPVFIYQIAQKFMS